MGFLQFIITISCLCFLPGFALLILLNLWHRFNKLESLILSIPMSLSILPGTLYLIGHFLPVQSSTSILTTISLFVIILVLSRILRNNKGDLAEKIEIFSSRGRVIFLFVLSVWGLLAISALFELDSVHRIIPAIGDYPKHDGIIHAIAGRKLPPVNPFFRPGFDIDLSYYYFFHLLPASTYPSSFIPPANIFAIFSFLVGIGFLTSMALFVRVIGGTKRHALVTVLLVAFIGGLDLIPLIFTYSKDISNCPRSLWNCWWGNAPILASSWAAGSIKYIYTFRAMIWSPQHLLAAMFFFLGPALFYLKVPWNRLVLIIPFALLTFVGSSIYLAILAVLTFFTWGIVFKIWRAPDLKKYFSIQSLTSFGITGLLIYLFYSEITPDKDTSTASLRLGFIGSPLFLQVLMPSAPDWLRRMISPLTVCLIGLTPAFLPILLSYRKLTHKINYRWLVILLSTSFVSGFLIQSTGQFNDFGIRSQFVARACFLILSAFGLIQVISSKKKAAIAAVSFFLVLGSLPLIYDVYGQGPIRLSRQLPWSQQNQNYIEACNFLRSDTPKNAIVQSTVGHMSLLYLLSKRRSVLLDHLNGTLFNVDQNLARRIEGKIWKIILRLDSDHAAESAKKLQIDYLILRNRRIPPKAFEPI